MAPLHEESLQNQWCRNWQAAGLSGDGADVYSSLKKLYSEPHRYYHNLNHIADCLKEWGAAKLQVAEAVSIELAIWFHDVIYDPKRSDNEEQSADFARKALQHGGSSPGLITKVQELIFTTKHHLIPEGVPAQFLVDIDLSILGKPPAAFDSYEAAIRAEYSFVPEDLFRSKRAEILQQFLQRKSIYHTTEFRQKYESQARLNLKRSIHQLTDR